MNWMSPIYPSLVDNCATLQMNIFSLPITQLINYQIIISYMK